MSKKLININLRSLLRSILKREPSNDTIKAFINICHKMAVAYLCVKHSNGHLSTERFGLNREDIALDSIADLFRRDKDGNFYELQIYFNRLEDLDQKSDEEIMAELRNLVFSCVNRGLFRLYQSFDPSLGKIIRNIKLALKNHPVVELKEYFKDKVIVPKGLDISRDHLPEAVPELISSELCEKVSPTASLFEMLGLIGEVLSQLDHNRKSISLTDTALIIRSIHTSYNETTSDDDYPDTIINHEIRAIIEEVLKKIEKVVNRSYVEKLKLTAKEGKIFLAVIGEILVMNFSTEPQKIISYQAIFKKNLPSLTKEIYNANFRTKLEYLTKLAKEKMCEKLKKEFFSQ